MDAVLDALLEWNSVRLYFDELDPSDRHDHHATSIRATEGNLSGRFTGVQTVSDPPVDDPAFEKHFRVSGLVRLWGYGRETVRQMVKDEPGVMVVRLGKKKAHAIYSIPESVARRIHTRLANPNLPGRRK